jgi:hypothetical protein
LSIAPYTKKILENITFRKLDVSVLGCGAAGGGVDVVFSGVFLEFQMMDSGVFLEFQMMDKVQKPIIPSVT